MQRDNFYSKISKRSFSKIYKNYSKGKISRVLPANIILSPFPYGFHPCNGEMQERVDLRVSLTHLAQGNQKREKGRERGKGEEREKERERERERGGRERRERKREKGRRNCCWPKSASTVGQSEARLEGAIVCKEQRAIVDKGIDAPRV